MVEHQGIAPCMPVWKTGVYLSTPLLGKNGVPCESRTHLRGFADHCLGCSANGTFKRRVGKCEMWSAKCNAVADGGYWQESVPAAVLLILATVILTFSE